MSNAEQNTGQKQQEQGTSEWDSLSEPFDTSKIENPTQDDLSYEAWLKSNANPDFETDRDGNPNRMYEAPDDTQSEKPDEADSAETVTDDTEFDPAKSRWSQMTKEQKYDLLHKHPRQEGEKTIDWGARIEAEEGVRIFGVEGMAGDAGTEVAGSEETATADSVEAQPEAENSPAEAKDTQKKDVSANSVEATSDAGKPSAEGAEAAEEASAAAGSAEANPVEKSTDTVEADASEEAPEAEVETDAAEEAPEAAVETEQGQEDAEKRKEELLARLGAGDVAAWIETDKKLTRGALAGMEADDLQKLVDEYEGLNAGTIDGEEVPGDNGEDASMLGAAVEAAPVQPAPEVVAEQATAEVQTEEAAAEKPAEKAAETAEAAEAKTIGEMIEKMNADMDGIREYHVQSALWERMHSVLDQCSEGVKTTVEYARAKKSLAREEALLKERRNELRHMPLFTLPWSEARIRKDNLRSIIKSSEASVAFAQKEVDSLSGNLPESLTDEEQGYVDSFAKMDTRMDRINADLHIRAELGAIGMREKWIRDQRKAMEQTGGQESPSIAKREAFIKKTQREIEDIQGRIDRYQEEHPDFVLHPDLDYKNPTYEQIVGEGMDETPDVEPEDDDAAAESEESVETTPLEKARARYDAVQEEMSKFFKDNNPGETDSDKILDSIDEYARLVDAKQDAEADLVYEEGAEILPEDMRDSWRKEVNDGKMSPINMENYRSMVTVLGLLKAGNVERARNDAVMFAAVTTDLGGNHLLDLISRYGGDEGKKLVESISAAAESDEAGSAEA